MNETQEFSQYHAMLSDLAQPALNEALSNGRVLGVNTTAPKQNAKDADQAATILLGVTAAKLLLEDDPAMYPALGDGLRQLSRLGEAVDSSGQHALPRLVDTAGHGRDVYWPFVLHLHLAAFIRRYESLPSDLWGVCEEAVPVAVGPARWIEAYTSEPPPPESTAVVLWSALCLCEQAVIASRDVDVEWVESVVHHMVERPGTGGALHQRHEATSSEQSRSLDAWTYRELCGLHALANLALLRRNQVWAKHVERIAMYHLEHTQPDNTTNQPWGVFGFLWSSKTRTMGQQQIHDAMAHRGGGQINVMAGMLLADAAAALEQLA